MRKKDNNSRPLHKDTEDKPGAGTFVNQLQLAQPGLVPKLLGNIKKEMIWVSQVMVDHFINEVYIHLTRSKI